jgi:Cytochrome c
MRFCIASLLLAGVVFAATNTPSRGVTFDKDVLPIFQKHCQTCHRPGEIGPMPLLTYQQARPWAKSIKLNVLTRKMPPWFADPRYGHFMNDRSLSEADINTIVSWVNDGAPEGDPKDKPVPIHWREGWNIKPDVLFQTPDAYPIPATGVLQYVYIDIPTGFTEDTWVAAAEIRPSARSVVHHMIAVVRPPGSQWMIKAKPFIPYIPTSEDEMAGQPDPTNPNAKPVNISYEFLAGYSPGMQAQRFDIDHSAKLIPAGSDIILQMHFTPNGKTPVKNITRIGLELAKQPPLKRFYSAVAASANWTIPPGDPNYEGHAKLTFGEPVEFVFMQPHMHLRGKDMTVRLVYPDGHSETILSVPHYLFTWQIVYYLAKPLMLPQGTHVEITAHWDNSRNNPLNPDPTATVKWGNQSTDEMLSCAMGVIVNRE